LITRVRDEGLRDLVNRGNSGSPHLSAWPFQRATKRRMGVRGGQDELSVRRIASARMGGWFAIRFDERRLDRAHFMGAVDGDC
jgi:hypothetical protein